MPRAENAGKKNRGRAPEQQRQEENGDAAAKRQPRTVLKDSGFSAEFEKISIGLRKISTGFDPRPAVCSAPFFSNARPSRRYCAP
jgi:hypothetical protein